MKLIYCCNCGDIFNIVSHEYRKCSCGNSGGRYIDNLNAEFTGDNAIPVGFHNSSFLQAVLSQPEDGLGKRFEAFVIPKKCDTFKKIV